jgi:hypothetical protein
MKQEDQNQTLQAISGRATGVLFFAGFGALWLCAGLSAMHRLNAATFVFAVAAPLVSLVIPALMLLRRVPSTPPEAQDEERSRQYKRTFGRVNGIQWTAIILAVVLLNIFHQVAYIVPVIATIVGLHLFPLARLFQYRAHYVTGTLLVLWSIGTATLLSSQNIAGFGAVGTAIILLISAAYTLVSATRAASSLQTTKM